MLKEYQEELYQEPGEFVGWRASMVGNPCETFLCHTRLNSELGEPIKGRVSHMLEDGNLHERDIVKRCVDSGYKVLHSYREGQLALKIPLTDKVSITGHPDGILWCGTKTFDLDRVDPLFKFGCRYYLLEVTAPNHYAFQRVVKDGLKEQNFQKYVQIQLYLMSDKIKEYGDSCVCVVKNKNTTALYEEGIAFRQQYIDELVERLGRVDELTKKGLISDYRCNDSRKNWCRYHKLCFDKVDVVTTTTTGVLDGRSLKEVDQLLGMAAMWKRGKDLADEGKELVEEAREEFQKVIADYGAVGLVIDDVKAKMIDGTSKSVDYDTLKLRAPDLYNEVVIVKPTRYVRVTS